MSRKIKSEQEGRWAKNRLKRTQLPASVWSTPRGADDPRAEFALDRWAANHDCFGCQWCTQAKRLTRMHRAYGRRRR